MTSTADLSCLPCGQAPCQPGTEALITPTTITLEKATMLNGNEDTAWLAPPPAPHSNPRPTRSRPAQQQGRPLPKQSRDGTTPDLLLPEDRKIGDGHRSAAISVSAKPSKSGNTGIKATYLDLISGPFFIEAFNGSGRMAASVRTRGLDAFEFDLTPQGGRRNILHASTLHELKALITHPVCRGI